jgi:hypothetical protein
MSQKLSSLRAGILTFNVIGLTALAYLPFPQLLLISFYSTTLMRVMRAESIEARFPYLTFSFGNIH